MRYSIEWIEDKGLLCVGLHGVVTGSDLLDVTSAVLADKRYRSPMNQLWDGSGIKELDVSWPHMQSLKEISEDKCIDDALEGKIALVASRQLVQAFAEVMLALTRKLNRQRKIFHTREAALEWLDASSMPVSP